MKIGLFGGTFDPLHNGHISLAEELVSKKYLEHIIFIPAAKPPHKPGKPITDFKIRMQMIEIAIKGKEQFSVSDIELKRLPSPSYTIDTVKEFLKLYPEDEIYLIIGEDSLLQIHTWYCGRELVSLCGIISYPRPGNGCTLQGLKEIWNDNEAVKLYSSLVKMQLYDISSTNIRSSIKKGEDVLSLLPHGVKDFISNYGLYK